MNLVVVGGVIRDAAGRWWLNCDGRRGVALVEKGYPIDPKCWINRPADVPSAVDVETLIPWPEKYELLGRIERQFLLQLSRERVLREVSAYGSLFEMNPQFQPGKDAVPPSGKVIGKHELTAMVDASLDGWLTTGRYNHAFESRLKKWLRRRHVRTVNSGSSANLVAISALTSPLLGERALKPGDEVITVAAGFPTTVNPIVQNNLVPVFVDIHIPTYNIDPNRLEEALSPKTRAIVLAHTLGNPFDIDAVMEFAQYHDLWVIEDCCDALGSMWRGKMVGSFGHIGTLSFYPAHHITTGEGGAVFTDHARLLRAMESIRDWGRDCWCAPGKDNTCGRRFDWTLGNLPCGYDHKYVYSHLGYNLKITDIQAACGLAQMDRLSGFIDARRRNFDYLRENMQRLEEFFILPEPTPGSEPSWFGFPLILKQGIGVSRQDLLRFLNHQRIGTRLLFAGNLLRQPYFAGRRHRVAGVLSNTERVAEDGFWIGVFPGLGEKQLDYVVSRLEQFFGV